MALGHHDAPGRAILRIGVECVATRAFGYSRILSSLIVRPPPARPSALAHLAPLLPNPGGREPVAIRLPTANRAAIRVMAVNAFAAPRARTFLKWQSGRLVTQKTLATQALRSWARCGPSDNADRMPRLF